MDTRKEMKAHAKTRVKKHYLIYIIACLLAAVMGIEFTSSLDIFRQNSSTESSAYNEISSGVVIQEKSLYDVVVSSYEEKQQQYNDKMADRKEDTALGKALGRRRGVLASIVNGVSSGSFMTQAVMAIHSITGSANASAVIFIFGSLTVTFLFWFFIKNTYKVVMRRIFMEGKSYDNVSKQRFLYLIRANKMGKAACTMFLLSVYQFLWSLTIIGGIIKSYSYKMVPYIVAENPDINEREAITLSRKMMNGYKWKCFVFDITFMGWDVLGYFTFGLTDLFFTNAYKTAFYTEFYYNLRGYVKTENIPGAELMNDKYLFEYAPDELLNKEYAIINDLISKGEQEPEEVSHGFRGFIAKWFGISLFSKDINDRYADAQVRKLTIKKYRNEIEKKAYPTRLSAIPEKLKNPRVANINYMRLYSVTSVILLFFSFCFIGWLWEVSLHLVSDGEFVNRGVLHGPWLPIYGMGGILILVLLTRLRKNPIAEFFVAVVLCGFLEYFTAYHLEMTHNGMKWWDYSGYFLNLHGRICAEGLLIFGIGGCAIVYFVAPLMDNLYRKINMKIAIVVCSVLIVCYVADQIYSSKHPNAGKGITDYQSYNDEQDDTYRYDFAVNNRYDMTDYISLTD